MKILIKESAKNNFAKFLVSAVELANFCFRHLRSQTEVHLTQSP